MKIYISGPMSNLPLSNYPAFNRMAEKLRSNGYTVFNPAEISGPAPMENYYMSKRERWIWYMKQSLRMMLKADTLVMLTGWKKSKGAKMERWIAKLLGYRIIEESDLKEIGYANV